MTRYQKLVIAILAFIQFTVILDFMMLSPLGATLMPALHITTKQFGMVVSAYAFAAAASGFLAAGFADSFDRKKLLLFFYGGFVLGTLSCGLAPTYNALLVARIVTGAFGGVLGSIVFAITTDLFPLAMRGRVMGFVQTAFAASQVLGIPIGLYFSNHWGWHAPFLMLVAIAVSLSSVIIWGLKPIAGHLGTTARTPMAAFVHLGATVSTPRYLQGFVTTALLATGGFMLMPFASAYSVRNLHVSLDSLPLVYGLTGACSIITGPLVGRFADQFGKFRLFFVGSIISSVMVIVYTNLGPISVAGLVAVSAVMFVGIQSRMIASQALMSAIPAPASRGAFMAVSACVQQLSGGLASLLAGIIVVAPGDERPLERFPLLGCVVVTAICITCALMWLIDKKVEAPTRGKLAPDVGSPG
jgi:predicted MFS family arabinose efflux permease